jgi:hypothetical protein
MADPDDATGFRVGQHVQLHPATPRAAIGDRFGKVVKLGRKLVHVKMDVSGHTLRLHPDKLLPMERVAD